MSNVPAMTKAPSEKPVTKRQMEIARFFVETFRSKGYWPSIREAAEHFDVYIKAICNHLELLEEKNVLTRIGPRARSFKVGENYGN